jgi:thiamine pyrophosphokinase
MRAVIFANGLIDDPSLVRGLILPEDYLIAADGGARHMRFLGISPSVIIGDLDSLPEEHVQQNAGVEIIRHSRRKDQTDLELAIFLAMQRGANEALIFGALGKRWDMTVANLFLGVLPEFRHMDIRLMDGTQEMRILQEKKTHLFFGKKGDILSFIPIAGDVQGITSSGLEYPLNDDTLKLGATRGISNSFSERNASIRFKCGRLMCITGVKP